MGLPHSKARRARSVPSFSQGYKFGNGPAGRDRADRSPASKAHRRVFLSRFRSFAFSRSQSFPATAGLACAAPPLVGGDLRAGLVVELGAQTAVEYPLGGAPLVRGGGAGTGAAREVVRIGVRDSEQRGVVAQQRLLERGDVARARDER